jgi:hypothetical protein
VEVQQLNVTHVYKKLLFDYQIMNSGVYANSYNVALYGGWKQKILKYYTVVPIFVCFLITE